METDIILTLYRRPETIFTVNEITQLCPGISYESIRDRLYYFTKKGKLIHPHYGIYAKPSYNPLELANKVYTPSYISLETVLLREGVVFQHYETIFAVSYLTRAITVADVHIQYRTIRKDILTNTQGVLRHDGYAVASLERAFLDAVYIYKNYHFDNLGPINWEKVETLKSLYANHSFEKRLDGYYQEYKEDHVSH